MAASQVGEGKIAQQLHRRFRIAAVERRAVQVILVEQPDIPQEDQLAVLQQQLCRGGSAGPVIATIQLRHLVVRRPQQQLGIDDSLAQELGVVIALPGFEVLGLGGELSFDDTLAIVSRLVGDLAEPRSEPPEAEADHAQDDHRPAEQGLETIDESAEGPEPWYPVDNQEEHEKRGAQRE